MTVQVTDQGVTIPKALLGGAEQVQIVEEPGRIVIVLDPAKDPIRNLGKNPVIGPETDASVNLDKYVYDGR
jgi:hypothetical protein